MKVSRRDLLAGAAGVVAAGAAGAAQSQDPPADPSKVRGRPSRALGQRAATEKPQRQPRGATSSGTPHQDLYGTITPSDLHFERHHGGVPEIDPKNYSLLVHGMVERPTIFTLADLKRFPAVSRVHFLECSGNFGGRGTATELTPQQIAGLTSTSEWTGVALATIFREVGVRPQAKWFLAEGGDAALLTRSIPVSKAFDDALVAYGQNGEAIRPAQGYPLRLINPGWEGNTNVKWLRRIKVVDQPAMVRDETSKYTDLMPDGIARQFTFVMDAKSVITFPSAGQKLSAPGFYEITGLAWSGRGRIERVEISTDGGATWQPAELQEPRFDKAFTRFRLPWRWDGREMVIQSRATDQTGYVQPDPSALIAVRGTNSDYHNNAIRPWKIMADGSVVNV